MKRILILSLLFLSMGSLAQQQKAAYLDMMKDPSVNFYTVVDAAEAYFKTVDKDAKGSGWKDFERWRFSNEYKYYPDGDRSMEDPFFVQHQYESFLKSNQQAQQKLFTNGWHEVGPTDIDSLTGHYSAGLGRIEDVYIAPTNPNILYLGSRSGGFWKSTNGGTTWIGSTTDFLVASGVNTITASPTNPDSVLINLRNANNGLSHGIYRSINGGNTWTLSNFNPTNVGFGGLGSYFVIYEIAYHPQVSGLVFIATSQGIYRSSDNLQTWTQLYGNQNITGIEFHPTNHNIIYLYNKETTYRNNVLISTDQGLSYTPSATVPGNNNSTTVQLRTSPDCPSCLYFASGNGVWRSTDAGQNFTLLSNPPQSCEGFAVSDLDTSNMLYGYVDITFSTDGGQNFNQVTYWALGNTNGAGNGNQISYNTSTDYVHADLRNARCVNGVFYVVTDGFLSKSTDNGVTWQKLSNHMSIRENYRIGQSQSNHYKVVCGSQDNGTSFSIENGWVEFYGADGMEAVVHPLNEDWFLGSVQYGTRRQTFNGGKSQSSATPANTTEADWIAPLAFDPNNHMHIYDFRDSVHRSDDFGDNHIGLGRPTSFSGNIKRAVIAENNSDIIIIARDGNIEKSTNGGLNFISIKNNLPNYSIEGIAIDPKNDDVMIVVYGRYQVDNEKVFLTTDGGATWTNITYNLGSMPLRSVVIDHSDARNIYVGAEIGVYTMPINGTNWSLYNTNLPNMSVLELGINNGSNTLKAATWGRGLWEYALVGRDSYPAIVRTKITNPPTFNTPKQSVDQFVSAAISYDNMLTKVYTNYSLNTPSFGNYIPMYLASDSTWVTTTSLPDAAPGTKVFFKVMAVGSNNDTTETYKFMYEIQPFVYCNAMGDSADGNLYISNVSIENINNSSSNDLYANYTNPILTIWADSTYTLDITGNTGWGSNDYGAWIDFNHDAEFTPDEQILLSIGSGSSATNTFTVPTAVAGNDTVIMRVRLSYWGEDPKPCGVQFGEVEDYTVLLKTNGISIGTENLVNPNADKIIVYPNPSMDKVYVSFTNSKYYDYELKSQTGQQISSGKLNKVNNSLDISVLAAGVYFLHIDNQVFKVVKKD